MLFVRFFLKRYTYVSVSQIKNQNIFDLIFTIFVPNKYLGIFIEIFFFF